MKRERRPECRAPFWYTLGLGRSAQSPAAAPPASALPMVELRMP
jgi:hypothetical protein